MNRRTFVASAGVGLIATVAGCLSAADPTDGSDPSDDDEDDSSETDEDDAIYIVALEDDPLEDAGEFAALEVELVDPHVEPGSPAALEATLSNTGDGTLEVSSGAPWPFGVPWIESVEGEAGLALWNDAYEDNHHVGTDGKRVEGVNAIGLVEEMDAEEAVTRTYELHEETPGLEAGTYETTIGCSVWPAGDSENHERLEVDLTLTVEDGDGEPNDDDETVIPEEPRVDEPPYEIEEPEHPEPGEEDDWNDHYLGENMPDEPSLEFETLSGVRLADPALSLTEADGDRYAVHLVESEVDRDALLDLEETDGETRSRLEDADFDAQVLVVVESGFGSGSVDHRWKRVEAVDDGVHLHGYYTDPHIQTDDFTTWQSALLVDRPEDGDVDLARASLTVDEETRVHVNSTEGPVTDDTGSE